MQPIEGVSIPRRALDVEDYIDIARRHKGWIFGPFLFTLVASVVGVYMWPDSYTSTAVIRVVPQQVPEQMVQTVSQQMNDRIGQIAQTIESRSVLTNIINNFGLYPKERTKMPIEDLVEDMKKNEISILPMMTMSGGGERRGIPAFSVSFKYENRYLAQKVVQDLVTRFIDESIRATGNQGFQTVTFMKDQVEQAKKELDDVEAKLQAFQTANNGQLPEQMDSNLRQLQSLETQVTILGNSISRANSEKLQIQTSIQILNDKRNLLAKEQPVEQQDRVIQQKDEKLAEAERDVTNVELSLNLLLQKYTESWPEVQTMRGRLAVAKKHRDDLIKEEAAAAKVPPAPAAPKPPNPQLARQLMDLDGEIRRQAAAVEARDQEVAGYNKDLKALQQQIALYSGKVSTQPAGQRQYGDLIRDREIAKEKYVRLDAGLQKAQISNEMTGRKQGETLEQLDPPSLPMLPTEPKRPLIISIGAVLGLVLGLVIAGILEMKDTSLKNLKDVRAYTQMAILGSIPLLENDFVVRRRKRLAWLGWTTASLAAVVIMSGSVVYYYVTKV